MRCRYLFPVLAFAGLLAAVGSAQAAQRSHNREIQLPHVCQGGPNAGQSCTTNDECPDGTCEINFLDTEFTAVVTLCVDDDVSKYDGTEQVSGIIAVTLLLEFEFEGKKHFLAQTYQNLEGKNLKKFLDALQQGPIIADTAALSRGPVNESKLNDALDPEFIDGDPIRSILDNVLLQTPDSEMADELRRIFGVTGKPVVASVPKTLEEVEHSDHESDGLASVARLEVKFRFVQEP